MSCCHSPNLVAVFVLFLPIGMLLASGGGLLIYLMRGGSRISTVLGLSFVGLFSCLLMLTAMVYVSRGGSAETPANVRGGEGVSFWA